MPKLRPHASGAILLCAALACTLAVAPSVAAASTERPNIVVIMTDDQRLDDLYADLGSGQLMPNTRRLIGAAGVSFPRSYVSYSLSCPSRTTFLTGQYAHNHGITANIFPGFVSCGTIGRAPVADSLAPWLQAAGYFTVISGRYLNAYPYPWTTSRTRQDPGWSRWYVPVTVGDNLADTFYDYYLSENGQLTPPTPAHLHEDSYYFSDVIVERAARSIEEAPDDEPVFVYLSHRAPHEDDDPPEGPEPAARHAMFVEALEQPILPSFDEEDISDKPGFFQEKQDRLVFGEKRQIWLRAIRRMATMRAVDDGVVEIVEALRRSGRLENTYLFFTSDNGFMLGEHRLPKGKIRPYEQSMRVPLMVAGPGIPAGGVSRELVSNVDLAPTILELSGVEPNIPVDGRSLFPYLRDPDARSGRPLLIHSFRDDSAESVGTNVRVQAATFRGVVLGQFKLVIYDLGEVELYDLERDPFELENAAEDPAYARTRAYLEEQVRRLSDCVGDECRREVPLPPSPAPPAPE